MTGAIDSLAAALSDSYTIEHPIGSGGMATVYLAEDRKHGRKVAIKVLRPDLAATLGAERFLQEIEIAAQLQHPHILPLLDSGEAGGFLYYVMPFVEGQSLRERLVKEGALPLGDAVRILRNVVDALTEAHAHGVVHRDIKPENILLRGRHALVMDFGVAKALSEAVGQRQLTTAGVALGTPDYMAPEQATGDVNIDHRVDLYAVGALGYELLTGRPVFMGTSAQMILAAHVSEAAQPVSAYRNTVPDVLDHIVMRCLEKKPADRWQSAEELLHQLEPLVSHTGGMTPTDTRPLSARSALGDLSGRRWFFPVGALAVVALLAASIVLATRDSSGGAVRTLQRIALLPIENVTGDSTQDYLAEGLTRELIAELTSTDIRVKGYRSVERFRGTDSPLAQIADVLQADVLALGVLHRLGERIQLALELTDPASGENVWARSYETESDDLPALTRSVAGDLARQLGSADRGAVTATRRVDPESYRAYLIGKHYAERYTPEGFRRAVEHFRRAVEIDPAFAPAWAGLGYAYEIAADYGFAIAEEAHAAAAAAVDSALALDPNLGLAHLALARLRQVRDWDFAGAEVAYQRAIQLSPTSEAYQLYGWFLDSWMGRHEEGIRALEKAVEIDPTSALMHLDLGWRFFGARDIDRAQAAVDVAFGLDSLYPENWEARSWFHAFSGRHEAALADLSRYEELTGIDVTGERGYYYVLAGRTAEARRILRELEERLPNDPRVAEWIAAIYVATGNPEPVFPLLEQLTDARENWFWFWFPWDPIRDDPRFQALLERIGVAGNG